MQTLMIFSLQPCFNIKNRFAADRNIGALNVQKLYIKVSEIVLYFYLQSSMEWII